MPAVSRVRAHYAPLALLASARFGGNMGGRLLLLDGLENEGDALLLAANIAGTASLLLEVRPEAIRYCVRNGIVDFAVTTLDEALRILKNEIRKQQPIAVLLEQPPTVLDEAVERGVQPDLLRWSAAGLAHAAMGTLQQRGACEVSAASPPEPDMTGDVRWRAGEGGSSVLRQLDLLAAGVLPAEDQRQCWIARAPRYLPRAMRLERAVAMGPQEARAFLDAIQESVEQKTLSTQVEVDCCGRTQTFG